ncbi:MAG: ABC transporter substrate-binding protein [Lachnospiraceae bacterium]|nr:ABC transporter substrate-binding protein [Lachnospiraceae bacterium]
MKKLISVMLCAMLILSMAACGKENAPVEANTSVEAVVSASEVIEETSEEVSVEKQEEAVEEVVEDNTVVYPVTVTDQAGREVVIEKEPETLVSGYYISSSLLIALELDDKMVGIEAKAGKRPIYKLAAKELIDLPSVGSAKEFDLEGCAALNADLVILPLKLKEAAATLDELGMTTVLVNPESDELLIEMIDIIATATNKVGRAEELKSFINEQKDMLNDKLSGADKKNVYLAGNSSVLSTAGNKMYQCGMIELAGGANTAAEIEDKYWVDVDYEQILAWNPDYIIIAAEAEYTVEDVLADEALAACNAVVNGDVYKIPSDAEAWDSPVPSGILGSVWMAGVLHPDVISSEESNGIIEEFYEKFYEFSYNEK